MISSARSRIDCGTVRPSALAVLRLTASSNLVGCSIRKIPRLRTLQYLVDEYCSVPKHFSSIRAVRNQSAGGHKLAASVNGRQPGGRRKIDDLSIASEDRILEDVQPIAVLPLDLSKCLIEFVWAVHCYDQQLGLDARRDSTQLFDIPAYTGFEALQSTATRKVFGTASFSISRRFTATSST